MNRPTKTGDPVEVSVIIPALDEEQTIGDCIQKIQSVFHKNAISGEIIVADSSTDRTSEIAQSLGAQVIQPEKGGYGNAYLIGVPPRAGPLLSSWAMPTIPMIFADSHAPCIR